MRIRSDYALSGFCMQRSGMLYIVLKYGGQVWDRITPRRNGFTDRLHRTTGFTYPLNIIGCSNYYGSELTSSDNQSNQDRRLLRGQIEK